MWDCRRVAGFFGDAAQRKTVAPGVSPGFGGSVNGRILPGLPPSAGAVVGRAPSPASVQQAPPPVGSAGVGARSTDTGEGACATGRIVPTGIFLTIATTRPETIPADTAVADTAAAVNPKDTSYQHLIGS